MQLVQNRLFGSFHGAHEFISVHSFSRFFVTEGGHVLDAVAGGVEGQIWVVGDGGLRLW
jgi:hypothetical protein